MASPRNTIWPWILLIIASLLFYAALALWWPRPGHASRAQRHWGGADFAISCDTVREWRGAIGRMSAARRAELARQFNITRKQRRQAEACLRGR